MERGMTLIEMAIALMLVAVVIAGIVTWMSNINQQLQLRGDAKHFTSVARAAQLYLKGENGTLLKEYDAGRRNKVVSVKDLQDKGYLATEIQAKLGKKQQDMTMLIRLSKAPSGNIEIRGLLMASGGISSTPNYTNDELGSMVNMAGISAGFMPKAGDPIQGISGSWKVYASDWNFSPSSIKPGYLVALLTDTLTMNSNKIRGPYGENYPGENKKIVNNKGKYININVGTECKDGSWFWGKVNIDVDGTRIAQSRTEGTGPTRANSISFIVPPGSFWRYSYENNGCWITGSQYIVTELN